MKAFLRLPLSDSTLQDIAIGFIDTHTGRAASHCHYADVLQTERGQSMRAQQRMQARLGKGIAVALVLAFSAALLALVAEGNSSRAAAQAQAKIEASIFSFDGKDFIRAKTTLVTEDGKSAVNTKLDRATPAYKALIQKHSWTGEATVFGRKYDADYAPLISDDGRLTGALFVAVAK